MLNGYAVGQIGTGNIPFSVCVRDSNTIQATQLFLVLLGFLTKTSLSIFFKHAQYFSIRYQSDGRDSTPPSASPEILKPVAIFNG